MEFWRQNGGLTKLEGDLDSCNHRKSYRALIIEEIVTFQVP